MPTDASNAWPALCTVAALVGLLILIVRFRVHAFAALLAVSVGLGLAAGLPPEGVAGAIDQGVGNILRSVAVILALGAMLGKMLDASGAAEVIARTLVRAFGVRRASLAILLAAYLVGIPVLFNVGFLLLVPIMWRLQRETGRSLLWFVLPLCLSLSTTHSLVPPHPGIVGAVNALAPDAVRGTVMVQTILVGALMGVPIVLIGWLGPAAWWARRQFVPAPPHLAGPEESAPAAATRVPTSLAPSFGLCLLIVTLPLLLSLVGFGIKLLADLDRLAAWLAAPLVEPARLPAWLRFLGHPPRAWLQLLGHPTMALLVPTALAFLLLGLGRGMGPAKLAKIASGGLQDVGEMVFLFGAAGGFMQVIKDTGAGEAIAAQVLGLPLSPVAVAYFVAVLMRMALGSATAAILTASALLGGLAPHMQGQETLLVLAVANGVTFMTQPADSGFWLVKEYCNLSVRDVMIRYNACRMTMSLTGLGLLLAYEAWWR
jgi:GntP family gluconate:H+ symporter